MGKYRLIFNPTVSKDLRRLPKEEVSRILMRIEELTDDPRQKGCQKLSGQARFRIRQGNYRILYEILDEETTVRVIKIGHRKDVYRD